MQVPTGVAVTKWPTLNSPGGVIVVLNVQGGLKTFVTTAAELSSLVTGGIRWAVTHLLFTGDLTETRGQRWELFLKNLSLRTSDNTSAFLSFWSGTLKAVHRQAKAVRGERGIDRIGG